MYFFSFYSQRANVEPVQNTLAKKQKKKQSPQRFTLPEMDPEHAAIFDVNCNNLVRLLGKLGITARMRRIAG